MKAYVLDDFGQAPGLREPAAATAARVLATCRPGEQSRLVLELGAQDVVDWTASPVVPQVCDPSPRGVDVVIEIARPRVADADAVDPALLGDLDARNIYPSTAA